MQRHNSKVAHTVAWPTADEILQIAGQFTAESSKPLLVRFSLTGCKMKPPAESMPAPLQALASFFDNARRVWDNQWAELQQRAGPRPHSRRDQLVFHMMNPVQRRIVWMPRPFASLTVGGTDLPPLGSGGSQQGPPNLLRAAKGGSQPGGTDGGASAHSAAEEKQERILISEVSNAVFPGAHYTSAYPILCSVCRAGHGYGLCWQLCCFAAHHHMFDCPNLLDMPEDT
jgi:hypothetical protein